MQTDEDIPAGLTPERAGFFTDAVFAIAMTLLVIDIPKPEDVSVPGEGKVEASKNLLEFLYHQLTSFSAYLVAFALLWFVWRQHHALFDRIDRLSRGLISLHFPLLLLIGFVPYATAVYEHHSANPAAAAFFALTASLLLMVRSALPSRAARDGLLKETVDRAQFRRQTVVSWAVAWLFLATILLSWWTPWSSIAWFLIPLGAGRLHNSTR